MVKNLFFVHLSLHEDISRWAQTTPSLLGGGGGSGGSTANYAVAANTTTAPMGGTAGPSFSPLDGTSTPATNGQPGEDSSRHCHQHVPGAQQWGVT